MTFKKIDLTEYGKLLASIKLKIRSAQTKASISVNKAVLSLYWAIGEMIIKKQTEAKWGDFLIEKLAIDLLFYHIKLRCYIARREKGCPNMQQPRYTRPYGHMSSIGSLVFLKQFHSTTICLQVNSQLFPFLFFKKHASF
jgi:hypothetical protein